MITQSIHMGENGKHLRLILKEQSGLPIEAIGFNKGDLRFPYGSFVDIVYNIHKNIWNNREKYQLHLIDIKLVN